MKHRVYTRAHPSFSHEDREKEYETGDTHNYKKKLRFHINFDDG